VACDCALLGAGVVLMSTSLGGTEANRTTIWRSAACWRRPRGDRPSSRRGYSGRPAEPYPKHPLRHLLLPTIRLRVCGSAGPRDSHSSEDAG
jgi:hypothetical protein